MYDIIVGRSDSDRERFGDKGTILLGKLYVKMGQTSSLSNKVYLDVNRAHVVFICGKRGSGKCLSGDALVTLEDGSELPISELSNNSLRVMALTDDLKVRPVPMTDFYSRKTDVLLHIKMRSGAELKLTPEHPLLTVKGWSEARHLPVGSRIAAPRKIGTKIATLDKNEKRDILAQSDIFWDEIISVEKLEGEFDVYDITVPGCHNFIANNIIVHNSYSMGVVTEGVADLPEEIKENISVVMLDTMGIYWTMKYPNQKDRKLLDEWGLHEKSLDVTVYTPVGYFDEFRKRGIPTDFPFSIKPSELDASDWRLTFELEGNDPVAVAIEMAVQSLKEKGQDYGIDDIIAQINSNSTTSADVRAAASNRFVTAKRWGLFDEKGTPINDLVQGGKVTILDVSCYTTIPGASGIRALVIGLVAQKLFIQRMVARRDEEFKDVKKSIHYLAEEDEGKKKEPLVWLVVDEAHEFLPSQGKTAATDPLVTILREGRQPGISLILASQQPGKIHTDVMTQSDIVLAHRLTANLDVQALGMLMQSYMREGLDKQLNTLPRVKGAAIVFDDANERMYSIRVRPRLTWHGGESPFAVSTKKKIFDF